MFVTIQKVNDNINRNNTFIMKFTNTSQAFKSTSKQIQRHIFFAFVLLIIQAQAKAQNKTQTPINETISLKTPTLKQVLLKAGNISVQKMLIS